MIQFTTQQEKNETIFEMNVYQQQISELKNKIENLEILICILIAFFTIFFCNMKKQKDSIKKKYNTLLVLHTVYQSQTSLANIFAYSAIYSLAATIEKLQSQNTLMKSFIQTRIIQQTLIN